jgi:tetratricopeptide (TPR) repeat protein
LVRIANEAARGDSLVLDVLTRHGGRDRPFLYDARLRTFAEAAILEFPGETGPRRVMVRDLSTPPEARIPTADQVLGYKIVEKTLRVDPLDDPQAVEPMVRREVILRLFVRLVDARTGIAQWAERFEASLTDRVPERIYRWLEKPPRQVYAYEAVAARAGIPARPGSDTAGTPIEYFTSEDLLRLNDADAVFWYHRNIGESYLRAGRLEDARRLLEAAVTERPGDYDARMLYAETLLKMGRLDDASREYVRALQSLGNE